jgi:hypothetical protein
MKRIWICESTHRQAVVVTVNQVYNPIVIAVTAAKSHPNFHVYNPQNICMRR